MARKTLTDRFLKNAKPGFYSDAGCPTLCFRVKDTGAKQWVQRLRIQGTPRMLGLGQYPRVALAQARKVATENQTLARQGLDPAIKRKQAEVPTFAKSFEIVLGIHRQGWRPGGKSEKQWRSSMDAYVLPKLGGRKISDINTTDVLDVLTPIWNTKRETAQRCRQRISTIMKWAVAKGFRLDDPASAISYALPRNGIKRKHMPALPYGEVRAALQTVRQSEAGETTKLAFEFLVLTAARSGEVRNATWQEVDMDARTWTIPGERMKTSREHRVPLSCRAIEILKEARELFGGSGLVFPSPTGRALSDSTMSKLCRELELGCVPHGMRSSFRDWAAECSDAPREVCEHALAHVEGSAAELAYRRTDYFEKRRKLMRDWAEVIV